MRIVLVLILLTTLLAQTYNRFSIELGYLANTGSYAKNCENKAKPAMHCNGKCQAMKKMKEEEKKDQQAPVRKSGKQEQVLSSRSFFYSLLMPVPVIAKHIFPLVQNNLLKRSFSIFHPPQV
jgi:hypothetical protein